jgi:hypothetical protein
MIDNFANVYIYNYLIKIDNINSITKINNIYKKNNYIKNNMKII